jgi:hypothetical protein
MNFGEARAKLRALIQSGVRGGITKATRSLGYELRRLRAPQYKLFESILGIRDLQSTETDYGLKFLTYCLNNLQSSNADLLQDLFVLFHLNNKVEGYFVEFGVMDGITVSNTFLLESQYSWSGIVAEPARRWRCSLKPDLNTLFCQATDITPLLAKFERPWHYASGGRGALRRVWVAALPAAARSA